MHAKIASKSLLVRGLNALRPSVDGTPRCRNRKTANADA
jgi:hypothetical protein